MSHVSLNYLRKSEKSAPNPLLGTHLTGSPVRSGQKPPSSGLAVMFVVLAEGLLFVR